MSELFDGFINVLDDLRENDRRDAGDRGALLGQGSSFTFAETLTLPTISGFLLEVRLQWKMVLRESYPRKKARLWQKDYDRVREAYLVQVFHRAMAVRFFVLAWRKVSNELGNLEQPLVLTACVSRINDNAVIDTSDDYESIIKDANKFDFVTFGQATKWSLTVTDCEQGIWSNELIERNYAMLRLPPETLEAITGDTRYRRYEEMVAVAALKRRLDIESALQRDMTDQEFGTSAHCFRVKTNLVGARLKLQWEVKPGNDGLKFVAYRSLGATFPELNSNAKGQHTGSDGDKIVDTIENGSVVVTLPEGREVRFRFAVICRKTYKVDDQMSFMITVPRKQDYDDQLERTFLNRIEEMAGQSKRESTYDKEFATLFKRAGHQRRMRKAIEEMEKSDIDEEIEQIESQNLSSRAKSKSIKDAKERIQSYYGRMRMEYLD
ncbi:hypothetical protein GC207_00020 [bacterium]|nr:hypothetical protein [bacterium]